MKAKVIVEHRGKKEVFEGELEELIKRLDERVVEWLREEEQQIRGN